MTENSDGVLEGGMPQILWDEQEASYKILLAPQKTHLHREFVKL